MPDTVANNEQVRLIIIEHLVTDADGVTPEATLTEDLGADSLDCVEITMEIEQAFSIRVDDDEAQACLTVGDWQQLVERKLA